MFIRCFIFRILCTRTPVKRKDTHTHRTVDFMTRGISVFLSVYISRLCVGVRVVALLISPVCVSNGVRAKHNSSKGYICRPRPPPCFIPFSISRMNYEAPSSGPLQRRSLVSVHRSRRVLSKRTARIALASFIFYVSLGMAYYCGHCKFSAIDAAYFIVITFLTIGLVTINYSYFVLCLLF